MKKTKKAKVKKAKVKKAKVKKAKVKKTKPAVPKRHHLDRRAQQILAADNGGADDELMDTPAVAQWFGVSDEWLELGRCLGYGPPFVQLRTRTIRYRRGDCREWLATRVYSSTANYRIKAVRP